MTDLKSPIDKYLEKLESYHNGIQFPGLPDRIEVNGCKLLSLFVMPRVKKSKSKGKQTRRAVSFDTMFRKDGKRKFVILGKPGAGKTTLLKYLMLEAAQKYLEDKKKGIASKQKLPLFVHIDSFLSHLSIRDNLKGRDDSIVSPLYGIFEEEYKIALPSGFLEEKLESGSVLLLFDGLDKVQDENRKKTMRSYIESLDARYPGGNTIIVATRPALCKRDSLLLKDYLHLELEDFNDKEIVQYLHAWYGSLEPDQHIAWAEELKRIIDSKVYLKEIAKTPLYLALIGRMHRYESR
ncbi:MAG: NACHT domain-containing protein, partial [bacterium]|nr:NACHT domain-containing protein [bacterium]